jgi:hypothetical protein
MAGDWLKIEKATARKPEVCGIAGELGISLDEAFGICFRFWCWVDDNFTTNAASVSETSIDALVGRSGFAAAMKKVGWLHSDEQGIKIPNFERHLSKGAKTRGQTAKRVESHAKNKREKRYDANAESVSFALPEKRREDMNTESVTRAGEDDRQPGDDLTFLTLSSDSFNRFWDALPPGMKSGRQACVKAFPDAIYAIMEGQRIDEVIAVEHLVERTKRFAKSPKGRDPEFRWSPFTFLRDGHYDDSDESWAAKSQRPANASRNNGASAEQVRKQTSYELLAAFAATEESGFSKVDEPFVRVEANR